MPTLQITQQSIAAQISRSSSGLITPSSPYHLPSASGTRWRATRNRTTVWQQADEFRPSHQWSALSHPESRQQESWSSWLPVRRWFSRSVVAYMFVEKNQRIQRLILCRGCHIPIESHERQIPFDLLLSFSQVIARFHVEMKDKALHPSAVASLCANRIVSSPHHIAHVVKDLTWR